MKFGYVFIGLASGVRTNRRWSWIGGAECFLQAFQFLTGQSPKKITYFAKKVAKWSKELRELPLEVERPIGKDKQTANDGQTRNCEHEGWVARIDQILSQ